MGARPRSVIRRGGGERTERSEGGRLGPGRCVARERRSEPRGPHREGGSAEAPEPRADPGGCDETTVAQAAGDVNGVVHGILTSRRGSASPRDLGLPYGGGVRYGPGPEHYPPENVGTTVRCIGPSMLWSRGTGVPSTRTALPSGDWPSIRSTARIDTPRSTVNSCRVLRPARATSTTRATCDRGRALRGRASVARGRPGASYELPRCIRITRSRIWRLGRARLPQHPVRRRTSRVKGHRLVRRAGTI